MAGLDELLELDDLQVKQVLVVRDGFGLGAFQDAQRVQVVPFAVEDTAKIELFAQFDVDLLVDVDQPQGGQDLLVEVAFEVGVLPGREAHAADDARVVRLRTPVQ